MIARRYMMVAAIALIVAFASGAALPPPPLPKTLDTNSEWSIPSATDIARHQPTDMALISSEMRWNGDSGAMSQEKSKWSLAGIITDNEHVILVTTVDNSSVAKRIARDESLPDGSVLFSVEGDRVTTKLDACLTTYQLFQAQPISRSADCEGTEVIDQGTTKQ